MSKKSPSIDALECDPARPFNAMPRLPPAVTLETHAVLKRCIEARSALAELKTATDLIPNPTMLINTIPLLEAQGSSEIESIVTTSDALFRHASTDEASADPATKETLQYRSALYEGLKSLKRRPLCTSTAVEVCSALKSAPMDIRKIPGTALTGPEGVVYTPPVGEALLRDLLTNWERFLHEETGIDPLVRLAVAHYQFEAIHPFHDGNGRTARIMNLLFLVQADLLTLPVLYLSRYVLAHKSDYYRLLRGVTQQSAWEPWVLFMLAGIEETALWTTHKIKSIRQLQRHTMNHVRNHLPNIYSRELVETLFAQPYCRIANLVAGGIAQRQTAAVYLRELCTLGILEELRVGRERLFVHRKLMTLLTSDG